MEIDLENIRETKREIRPVQYNGKKFYELTVVQEYYEENVKNMLEAFKTEIEHTEDWLHKYEEKEAEVVKLAEEQMSHMQNQITSDMMKSDEDVLKDWKQELEEKKKWLKDYDTHKEEAIRKAKEMLQKSKEEAERNLMNTKKGLEVWHGAL